MDVLFCTLVLSQKKTSQIIRQEQHYTHNTIVEAALK